MKPVWLVFAPLTLLCAVPHNVRDYGAKGDGVAKDTAAIQAAVDAAARAGGGVVVLPAGNYLCGTIRLKSHITIEITSGARLTASPDAGDFDKYEELPFTPVDDRETTDFHHALLRGEGVEHVSIQGGGVIDGDRVKRGGPKTVAFKNSSFLSVRGVTIRNAPITPSACWAATTPPSTASASSTVSRTASIRTARVSSGFPTATSIPMTTPSA